MEGLTAGRMVHYVPAEDDPGYGKQSGAVSHRAAVVNAIEETHFVRLFVFADPIYDEVPFWSVNTVPYSEGHEPRTWHWIEKA